MTVTQLREIARRAGLDVGGLDKAAIETMIRDHEESTGKQLIDPLRNQRLVAEFVAQLRAQPDHSRKAIAELADEVGVQTDVRRAIIRAALTPATLRAAMAAQLRSAGVKTGGGVGSVVLFDAETMASAGAKIKPDAMVRIVEPPYMATQDGDDVVVRMAVVEPAG